MRILTFFAIAGLAVAETVEPDCFEKETVVAGGHDITQFDIAADGRIVFLELAGAVKVHDPATRLAIPAGELKTLAQADAGALGLALARDFLTTGHVFLYYSPDVMPRVMRLARVTLREGKIDPALTKTLLEVPLEPDEGPSHCGGGLWMHTDGTLLIGTGDNSPPQDVPAIHPVETKRDSRRSAGNSQDLRGKILRIKPNVEGGYSIPAGNMFADAAQGRAEVFAMGVRNPFRVAADPQTGWITWGEVGGNVKVEFGLGPEGYDEINVARAPGFFGWPFCSGPNAPWRMFDPKSNKPAGEPYDPAHIINDSPANTGLRALPPAQLPVVYYPCTASEQWPFVGTGGRSVTGGVFFRSTSKSELRLPDSMDGALFFGEWMRNWVAVARLKDDGSLASAERFLPDLSFAKPSDFKIGPDGALYVAEMGDKWSGNTDSRITRVVYRRGNRAPVAKAAASVSSGGLPLRVVFSAAGSRDPDKGDALRFAWDFGGGKSGTGAETEHTFTEPGVWPVTLTVTDGQGLSSTAMLNVAAGNEAPRVTFTEPLDGSFFEWGKPVAWRVSASDKEDGALPPEKVLVQMEQRDRLAANDDGSAWPGLAVMRRTTCFACHSATEKSAGPPYTEVARRYAADSAARPVLAAKILSGGTGVWGALPMPPHPQHTAAEAAQMVDWILSLSGKRTETLPPGLSGTATVKNEKRLWNRPANGVLLLTASAADNGAAGVPAQRGESSIVLRTRQQRACFFDRAHRAVSQDNLDQGGQVARISAGGWISFDRVRLDEVSGLRVQCWPQGGGPLTLSVRIAAEGPALGSVELPPGPATGRGTEAVIPLIAKSSGLHDLMLTVSGNSGGLVDVMRVEFLP